MIGEHGPHTVRLGPDGLLYVLSGNFAPIATSIDSPTGTVLVLLSATAGSAVIATGAGAHAAVETVMLIFTAATVTVGAVLYLLGLLAHDLVLRRRRRRTR